MSKQIIKGDILIDGITYEQVYAIRESNYSLVFDTETFEDISQHARLGIYALVKHTDNNPNDIKFERRGMVSYDLTSVEDERLKQYCYKMNITYLTKHDFIHKMLFPLLKIGCYLVGHNIAFDIGSIATSFEVDIDNNIFRFKLCDCSEKECMIHPTLVIKPVKTKKALMYIEHDYYGAIVDTITIGNALLGTGSSSLNAMVSRFGFTDDKKEEVTSYGEEYTEEMYSYALHDVELTTKILIAAYQLYKQHDLPKLFHTIMSEASIGKAYEEKLGIPPFKYAHIEVGKFLFDLSNHAYYGARTEVHIKDTPVLVRYTDFKSQYPLVNALLRLQDYILAKYLYIEKCVEETQMFLEKLQLDDLRYKDTWKLLSVLVKVKPNSDILPYRDEQSYGQQNVTGNECWYSLCDVVASYIRTGKIPTIIDAYKFVPSGKIETNIITLFGDENFKVDLSKDDFFTKVIDLRDSVKADIKQLKVEIKLHPDNIEIQQRKKYLDNLQLALKLMANSTSYGILVETREINRQDIAGKYNALPIGVHITAAARLLLAIAERLGLDRGIEHALCDTDSFAYAKPDTMEKEEFYKQVQECIDWFNPLSPFKSEDAVFELEEYNYFDGKEEDLYAYGISSKRYVLYNRLSDGKYRIRKLSSHGLTRYQFNINIEVPEDVTPIPEDFTGKRLWYPNDYVMWYRGIAQIEKGIKPSLPEEVWSKQAAIKQQSITTPKVFNMFKHIPEIRPYCFFSISPYMSNGYSKDRYYMPFASNFDKVTKYIKDSRVKLIGTNEIVTNPIFDTLKDRFDGFYEHEEKKAENGKISGIMQRRSVTSTDIEKRTRSGKRVLFDYSDIHPETW